ncbi:MAG: HD domain-containing protein [Eubacteriales bacterium]|nr:HD domain-containing protein [Eubacteriales bacterium]
MAIRRFAAIDIGSYELGLKIFECTKQNGIRAIDHITHRIDLGSDTYNTGKISHARVEELKRVLTEYRAIMENYRVTDYKAYGTSAIRETDNASIVLNQLEQHTGIRIDILSNSEQRFLDYKSIASKGEGFTKIIEKGTAIVDIGGGSIQISLFAKDRLVETQNLKLGVLRLYEQLHHVDARSSQYEAIIEELVNSQLMVFKNLYLKEREIKNIIIVDDYISAVMQRRSVMGGKEAGYIDASSYLAFMEKISSHNQQDIAKALDIADDKVPLLYISGVLVKCVVQAMGAELIWAPGVTLCDGMVYEFAEQNKIMLPTHDFDEDIIACARTISKRYKGSKTRSETLETIALRIFEATKQIHGLGQREKLLLRIATLLHDCGKYISLVNLAECSYHIIMSTEIIGLSHIEREIIANVVKFNHSNFVYYEQQETVSDLGRETYLVIAKLTAILRIANGLDRSHKQKFRDVGITVRDGKMIISVSTKEDITLEKGLFTRRADFFEEIFSVRPVIKQKRTL